MLSAYAQRGDPDAALRFFGGMVAAGVELDAVVMDSWSACYWRAGGLGGAVMGGVCTPAASGGS